MSTMQCKKREALQRLEKKEMYGQQLTTLRTSKMNLETNLTSDLIMLHGIDADDVNVDELIAELLRLSDADDVNDDELLAESDRLMEEFIWLADLSKVDLGRAVEMTSAQKRGKAGFLEQLRKRIMGIVKYRRTTEYTEGGVEAALRNYEAFHGRPFGSATVEDLQSSCAEIGGWLLAGPHFAKSSRLWRAAPTALLSRGPGR